MYSPINFPCHIFQVLGYIVGVVHGLDASMALKFMRTAR
jgi:hypothetical protein